MVLNTRSKAQPTSGINLTQNALYILEKRYLKRNEQGKLAETPEGMLRRVAWAVASAEPKYDPRAVVEMRAEEFYRLMASLEFLPNSPTLVNAGRKSGQLSSCFVLPVEDSVESIFDAVRKTALIHKSGGGTGFSFSKLRPERDQVNSKKGVASGPVSFLPVFSLAADVIKQGSMRRGCSMAVLNVDHPDIMKFATAKNDPDVLTNFYLSVAVTTEFMEAVKAGAGYNLINPRSKKVVAKVNAKEVFDKIVEQSWKTGDPGIVFIDRIEQDNPTPKLGRIESVSGCGEQPLLPYESCNLGSINLARMLCSGGDTAKINYPKLAKTVKTAVRFLDDVIDVNNFPLPEIGKMTKRTRKVGLGVMGFADMLIQLGISYNSEEALKVASEVMEFINEEAKEASVVLAEERGVFPSFKGSIYDISGGPRLRNASRTTIAPTGTLSLIAGCSCGIEPTFALVFVRNILGGKQLLEINPYFEKVARQEGFYSEELMQKLVCGNRLRDMAGVTEKDKRLFVTANEIDTKWHVRMQAAFQRYTDNAVSKTVNLPHEATQKDIAAVYMMAYEERLKGITVYRDGSRELQPLFTGQAGAELIRKRFSPKASLGHLLENIISVRWPYRTTLTRSK